MHTLYSVEVGFLAQAIISQIFFAAITLFISYLAFTVFGLTGHKQSKSMFLSFFFIFLSYAIQGFFNILTILGINPDLYLFFGIHPLSLFHNWGIYFHVIFMTFGFAILMYTTFNTENRRLLTLLLISSILIIFISRDLLQSFFILTSLYLGFLFYHFLINFWKRKKLPTLLIATAFLFLFFAQFGFIFITRSTLFYIFSHVMQFIAYSFILLNYYLIKK